MSLQTLTFRVRLDGELVHEETIPVTQHRRLDAIAKKVTVSAPLGAEQELEVEFSFDPPLLIEEHGSGFVERGGS